MAFNRYETPGGRNVPEMGSTTPQVEFQESERFGVDTMPAPYLPSARFDDHKRANIVLSAGTPVAYDTRGGLIPAGIPDGHTFVYSANDFQAGVTPARNANTGAVVAAAGNAAMAADLIQGDFFSNPVGIASYNIFAHDGGVSFSSWPTYTLNHDNPVNYGVHNSMAQDLVALTLDFMIEVPYVYGRNLLSSTVKIFDNTADEAPALAAYSKSFPFAHDELVTNATLASGTMPATATIVYVSPNCGTGDTGGGGWITLTSGATANTVKFTAPGGSVGAEASIASAGYTIAYDGADTSKYVVLKLTGATAFASTAVVANLELQSQLRPGDFVVCRAGKFVKFDDTRHLQREIIGQVMRRNDSPIKRDLMDRVKTAYDNATDMRHRMAGSATRGVPQLLHLVTDGAQVRFETKKVTPGSKNSTAITATGLPTSLPLSQVVINLLR